MDLNKLLRRKQSAEDENNQQALAEVCNKLGNHYMSEAKYEKALSEFREESNVYQALDKKMDFGRANRMISEVFMLMEKHAEALKYSEIYVKLAKQENDLVEMQRAYATIGRCYLLKASDSSSARESDSKAAERAFLKSLIICKQIGRSVTKWELADMQARLYLNLGVTKEQIHQFEEAISFYDSAIKICKSNDLFELHHQCLMASSFAYSNKRDDTTRALTICNEATEVAKRIQDKNEKMCETLLAKSILLIKNGDFQSSKQVLKKAYKMKTPNKADSDAILRQLKTVVALCKCEDELVVTDSFNYSKRKELFEKLGDGACKLKTFSKALDFYLKSLEAAQLNGDSERQLIPIYVSLYQTYIDNNDFEAALEYMKKEFELIKNEPKEACATLLSLGNLMDLAEKDFWEVDGTYRKALVEAKKIDDQMMEKTVTIKLIKFCKKRHMLSLAEILEQEATDKGMNVTEQNEDTEDIQDSEDIPDISNDISIELELSSDPDSSENEQNRSAKTTTTSSRKKRPALTVKKNLKGETRLHEACINGNYQLAKMLIDQGHGLNVRDNAGWLPLHEAAIHGHRDVAELLLESGAQTAINDKGGTSCDGITPLYDAASNGNLSVVQLLLDRGAKATVKTDFNETPLDALQRWHSEYGQKLSLTELEFYEEIKQRLTEQCEKIGIDTSSKCETLSSGYNSGKSKNSQPSRQRSNLRFNTSFSEESEEDEKPKKKEEDTIKKTARQEYKSVMKQLKNPHIEQRFGFAELDDKMRTAHLTVQEVELDNWLDDDLGPSRKKQKFSKEASLESSKSPSKAPTPVKSFARKPSSNLIDSDSDVEANNEPTYNNDAFDVVMSAGNAKIKPKRRSSIAKLQKKSTSQPSLLDSGFSKFIETDSSRAQVPPTVTNFNESLRLNIIEKQLIIKVQIEDERVIVPVNRDNLSDLKISWLADEAASRFYVLKGIRPELKLKTSDGATLLQTDPVSLILSLTDENLIHSEILDWKLPSLSKRYMEACTEMKCSVDQEINEMLDINRTSVYLDLSNQNLTPPTIRPVLKALQHQSCLLQLDVSSNFIQDEGVKCLTQTLMTLKQLLLLDLSGNMMTESSLEFFYNALSKSQNPSEIRHLKLSFNPIKSVSLKTVSSLCQVKHIVSLSLSSCDLTDATRLEQLGTVKSLDISFNLLTRDAFKRFLRALNPGIIESMNLERCSIEPDLGEPFVQFLTSGCYANMADISLAGLNFDENDILDILRCLEKCGRLKNLDLSYQTQLTFLSLKYLFFSLESPSLECVKLVGCKNLKDANNMFNFQNIEVRRQTHLRNVQLSVPRDMNSKIYFVEKMSELWDVVSEHRGKIENDSRVLRLLNNDDSREPPHRL